MQRCLFETGIAERRKLMGSMTDKIKGTANEAMGKAKQNSAGPRATSNSKAKARSRS